MPHAHIHIIEGRTEEQKSALIRQVTEAIHETIGAPKESVFVVIHEMPTTNCGQGGTSLKEQGR